jgi:hypothetical protein
MLNLPAYGISGMIRPDSDAKIKTNLVGLVCVEVLGVFFEKYSQITHIGKMTERTRPKCYTLLTFLNYE